MPRSGRLLPSTAAGGFNLSPKQHPTISERQVSETGQAQTAASPLLTQPAQTGPARLVEIYAKVLDADIDIKTGKWQDELALDLLVADVCS